MSSKTITQSCEARNQLAVAAGEAILVELDVVFDAGADVSTQFKAPLVDLELMTTNSCGRPGRIGHEIFQFGDEKFQELAPDREGIGNAHHKLNLTWTLEEAAINHDFCVVEHRYVKNLDLRLHVEFKHGSRELFDKLRWIFINLRGEVDRARGQRSHMRLEVK